MTLRRLIAYHQLIETGFRDHPAIDCSMATYPGDTMDNEQQTTGMPNYHRDNPQLADLPDGTPKAIGMGVVARRDLPQSPQPGVVTRQTEQLLGQLHGVADVIDRLHSKLQPIYVPRPQVGPDGGVDPSPEEPVHIAQLKNACRLVEIIGSRIEDLLEGVEL